MSPSVSVILPVCNQQYGLRDRVLRLLEILPELTADFELFVVDYGSTDQTPEVAVDLAIQYPQLYFLDRSDLREALAAIEDGIRYTRGEIIFVHDPAMSFSPRSLQTLWALRDDPELVMAQARAGDKPAVERVRAGLPPVADPTISIQMIRRRAIHDLREPVKRAAPADVDRVTRTDLFRHSDDPTRSPNLISRLRRIALG